MVVPFKKLCITKKHKRALLYYNKIKWSDTFVSFELFFNLCLNKLSLLFETIFHILKHSKVIDRKNTGQ